MDPEQHDVDDDFVGGFNSGEGDGQPEVEEAKGSPDQPSGSGEQPAGQQEATPPAGDQPSSSAEPAVDPYAGLPEPVRELLAKIPSLEAERAAEAEARRRLEGQVRSFQSRLDKLSATPPPAPAEPPRLEKLAQAKEALGTDLPEVMDALDELAALLPKPQALPPAEPQDSAPAAAAAQPAPVPAPLTPEAQAAFDALDAVRPDWFETLDSADCKLFLTTRPELAQTYQGMRTAGDALKVLGEFDRYRQSLATAQSTATTRQTRMAAGVLPSGGARAPARVSPGSEDDGLNEGFYS